MQTIEVPHLRLLIAGVAAILLATSGITAVMALMPDSTDVTGVVAPDNLTAQGDEAAHAREKCAECGVVESMRKIEQHDDGIKPGAADGATKKGHDGISGKSSKSFEVTVRMSDGASHQFMEATPANWRLGERVIFIERTAQSINN